MNRKFVSVSSERRRVKAGTLSSQFIPVYWPDRLDLCILHESWASFRTTDTAPGEHEQGDAV